MKKAALVALLMATLPAIALASPPLLPKRASGLWKVEPEDTFIYWSFCVQSDRDNVIDNDLWTGFDQECQLVSEQLKDRTYRFKAKCGNDRTLEGTIKGDFIKEYRIDVIATANALTDQAEPNHIKVTGHFAGDCPPDMPPGSKKINDSMLLKGFYDDGKTAAGILHGDVGQ